MPGATPKKPALGVDRVELAVLAGLDPGDVVADRRDLPAFLGKLRRRDQHREVRLAAGARGTRRRRRSSRPSGRLDADDQHVLGQPALVARHHRGDAQREALLAQQRVAAVARAVGPDRALLGEVDDVLVVRGCTATAHPPGPARAACRPSAGTARTRRRPSASSTRAAHAGHDPHVHDDVRRVGQLDADLRDRRADRAHAERDHVHRAAAHRSRRTSARSVPFISRGSIQLLVGPASPFVTEQMYVRSSTRATSPGSERPRKQPGRSVVVQPDERAGVDHLVAEPVVLLLRAVAPVDLVRLAQRRDVLDPQRQLPVREFLLELDGHRVGVLRLVRLPDAHATRIAP